MSIMIRSVEAPAVRPLRQRVLRPTQAAEALVYGGDDDPRTLHAAALAGDEVVGIATIVPDGDAWRVRGMATAPEQRGLGLGRQLLEACLVHAASHGGGRVWCNARTTAQGFYERMGFTTVGGVFELPDIGPHVVMERTLAG